ncbi:related to neutral ceramidase [Melanopsichium pennsylvanicum]|uniref:Neutral ceramidase n=2 Tax=Melanopsichium pennsylvanicum TaxID=63383 RepID=A0AAJ4XIA8_9BASI|nr:related to neutral ceramidase [Melanopsichium pennsylvanicum 4]SNX81683.1 related to neutral ceramidase [Melanopsichium pennsylvanicum]
MIGAGYHLVPSTEGQDTILSIADDETISSKKHTRPFSNDSTDDLSPEPRRTTPWLKLKAILLIALVCTTAVAACCAYRGAIPIKVWTSRPLSSTHPTSIPISSDGNLIFGLGIGDVTGPIVEVNMMGYASLPQTNTGLHIRLRSRAFIVGSSDDTPSFSSRLWGRLIPTADGSATRWLFINSDICMGDTAVRKAVVEQLRENYPGIYGERNVAFVGTHSHAGPGGFMQSLLPTLTSKGVILQNFDAIVSGTVQAAVQAHDDFLLRQSRLNNGAKTRLSFGKTRLEDAHIQRSRYAYEQNPQQERDLYNDEDQDHDFGLLKFEEIPSSNSQESLTAGFLSWYAVHGTSLYENNTLTSGDNKGLAALLYETAQQPDRLPGQNGFVAGFSQALVGDTSPNTKGAWCDDGSVCEYKHSTCDNGKGKERVQTCHGRGPAWGLDEYLPVSPTGGYDWASNEMIARKQVDAARSLMDRKPSSTASAGKYDSMTPLTGPIKSVKMNIDMSQYTVYRPNGTRVKTCPAALGYGFAGGTTDGPGAFDFVQGSNKTDHHNPFWDLVKGFIKNPGPEQIECQAPKAILLDIGEIHRPYDWGPSIVEVQILRLGQLFILVVPGEFTTMAGRRLKRAVSEAIKKAQLLEDGVEPIVQVSGPASTYGHYVTTQEEYSVQRYEGASTLFGPHTLEAYMDVFSRRLVPALRDEARDLPLGPQKEFDIRKAWKFKTGVVYDNPPFGHSFGDVLEQPLLSYPTPNSPNSTLSLFDTNPTVSSNSNITVTFVGANPRNNLRLESTYFEIQRYTDRGMWSVERTDGHHSTTMRWTRTNELHGSSKVEVGWDIEPWTKQGLYRVVYYGDRKTPFTGKIQPFEATSAEFYVV